MFCLLRRPKSTRRLSSKSPTSTKSSTVFKLDKFQMSDNCRTFGTCRTFATETSSTLWPPSESVPNKAFEHRMHFFCANLDKFAFYLV